MTNPDLAAALQHPGRPTLYLGGDEDAYWTGLLEQALTAAGFAPDDSIDEQISDVVVHAFGGTLPERFDYTTSRAVHAFQRHYQLTADGVVSDVTWDTLAWALGGGENYDAAMTETQPNESDAAYEGEAAERLTLVMTHDDVRFEQWLRAFNSWMGGSDGPFFPGELETFQWAQDDPDVRAALEALQAEDHDNQLGIWKDGRIETNRAHEIHERRELFVKGAKALAGSPLGAAMWGAAKALGADDEQAISAAEMGNSVTELGASNNEAHERAEENAGGYPTI